MTAEVVIAGDAVVALIGATGVVIAAMVGLAGVVWSTHRRIGKPNGHGNLVEMSEQILSNHAEIVTSQVGQDKRLARLEDRTGAHDGQLARLDTRVTILERTEGVSP